MDRPHSINIDAIPQPVVKAHLLGISGLLVADKNFVAAEGCYLWDEEGERYLDLVSGYGSVILGHANGDVVAAVSEAIKKGNYLYGRHPAVDVLKQKLLASFRYYDDVLLFKTGSEAVQAAIRLARASSGRDRIVRCGFHGWHDQFLTRDISWHRPTVDIANHQSVPGVPAALQDLIIDVAFSPQLDWTSLLIAAKPAALIIDPVQISEPIGQNLRIVAQCCREANVVLIIDEAKTGFRIGPAGVQGRYGVSADITILSKAIANGFPLAAVLVGPKIHADAARLKIMGTFNHELSAIIAALECMRVMEQQDVSAQLEASGTLFLELVQAQLLRDGAAEFMTIIPFRWPSMPYLAWAENVSAEVRLEFRNWMSLQKILWLPNHMNFLNLAHSAQDFCRFTDALTSFWHHIRKG
jgi:glutamate-1-semialdehyde aminotransferase